MTLNRIVYCQRHYYNSRLDTWQSPYRIYNPPYHISNIHFLFLVISICTSRRWRHRIVSSIVLSFISISVVIRKDHLSKFTTYSITKKKKILEKHRVVHVRYHTYRSKPRDVFEFLVWTETFFFLHDFVVQSRYLHKFRGYLIRRARLTFQKRNHFFLIFRRLLSNYNVKYVAIWTMKFLHHQRIHHSRLARAGNHTFMNFISKSWRFLCPDLTSFSKTRINFESVPLRPQRELYWSKLIILTCTCKTCMMIDTRFVIRIWDKSCTLQSSRGICQLSTYAIITISTFLFHL